MLAMPQHQHLAYSSPFPRPWGTTALTTGPTLLTPISVGQGMPPGLPRLLPRMLLHTHTHTHTHAHPNPTPDFYAHLLKQTLPRPAGQKEELSSSTVPSSASIWAQQAGLSS